MIELTPRMRRVGWRRVRFDEVMGRMRKEKVHRQYLPYCSCPVSGNIQCLALVGPIANNLGCFRLTITSQTYSNTPVHLSALRHISRSRTSSSQSAYCQWLYYRILFVIAFGLLTVTVTLPYLKPRTRTHYCWLLNCVSPWNYQCLPSTVRNSVEDLLSTIMPLATHEYVSDVWKDGIFSTS